jgi:hypothetical protein
MQPKLPPVLLPTLLKMPLAKQLMLPKTLLKTPPAKLSTLLKPLLRRSNRVFSSPAPGW